MNKKITLKTKNDIYSINIESNSILKNLNKIISNKEKIVFLVDKNNCEEWCEQSKNSVAFNLADKINKIFTTANI